MNIREFEGRKKDHIQHALNPAHQATGLGGLDWIRLIHEALPELDFDEVRLTSTCLGRTSATPFYIAGMTAGHEDAPRINRALALACQERGWAMGVGSQRRELEASSDESAQLDHWELLRESVPRLTLFANLGLSQLIEAPTSEVQRLAKSIRAQALVIHANPLQEALQPEGTPRFKGALQALGRICGEIDMPVVLKETGCGFSSATLRRLSDLPLAAVDVSGLGGTHWGRIEGARSPKGSPQAAAAQTFAEWGEPTVETLIAARQELKPRTELWASGGVRTGLDAAKLIALGAHQIGFAKPALEAALAGDEVLRQWMAAREYELRVALFCTGCASPADLRRKEGVWKAKGI